MGSLLVIRRCHGVPRVNSGHCCRHGPFDHLASINNPVLTAAVAIVPGELFGIVSEVVANALCRGRESQPSQEATA